MFNRPGHKLKIIAIVIFYFFTILGVLAGFILSATINDQYAAQTQLTTIIFGDTNPASIVFVIAGGILGMLVGWINSILLYAFGSLVDDVETIKQSVSGQPIGTGGPARMK